MLPARPLSPHQTTGVPSSLLRTGVLLFLSFTLLAGCKKTNTGQDNHESSGGPECTAQAQEICDGIDNTCNGTVDEGCDDDSDGYCDGNLGFALADGANPSICPNGPNDCDDTSNTTHPNAAEFCDDVDNTCNQLTDEGCDEDDDGYCVTGAVVVGTPVACRNGINDCNDANPNTYPGAQERCDNELNDCSMAMGTIDLDCDPDGDGWCDASRTTTQDAAGSWPAACPMGGGDCREDSADIHPGATEACNNVDENCDMVADEGCDEDGDDYCNSSMATSFPYPSVCPLGPFDCDDTRTQAHQGAVEICNDLDDDCDMVADNGCNDDGDNYCDGNLMTINLPAVCSAGGGDCDDTRTSVHPGPADGCGADWNCDGQLLALSFLDPVNVRGTQPVAGGVDMAFNGTNFGVVWAEELDVSRTLRFATMTPSGTLSGQILSLAPLMYNAAIDWSAARNAWAIAFTAPDPMRNQWSAFLMFVDASNVASQPVYIDKAAPYQPIKTMVGATFVNVFYTQRAAAQLLLKHASYNAVTDVFSTPVQLFADSFLSVRNFSYAWYASSNTAWVTRHEYRAGGTQPYGYEIAGVRGNGSLQQAATWYPFPDGQVERYPALAVISGNIYMMWVNSSVSPDTLRLRRISSSNGSGTGTIYTIASNVRDASGIAYSVAAENASTFGLLYQDDTAPNSYQLARISSSTFATVAGPYALAFNSLSSQHSVQAPLFFNGTRYYALNATASPGYFAFYGINTNGTLYRDEQPVTGATLSTSFNSLPRFVEYDPAADEFYWLQVDPSNSANLQDAIIAGDGTVTRAPAPHSSMPQPCQAFSHAPDGTLICLGTFAPNCDTIQVQRHSFGGNAWWQSLAADELGNNCETALEPVAYLGNNRTAVLEHRQDNVMGLNVTVNYNIYGLNGVRESSTELWRVTGLIGSVTTFRHTISGTHIAIVAGTYDSVNTTGQLVAAVAELNTGNLLQSNIAIAAVPGRSLVQGSLHFNGDIFAGGVTAVDPVTAEFVEAHAYFFGTTGSATFTTLSATGRVARSFGTPNYNVFVHHLDGVTELAVASNAGVELEVAPFSYTGVLDFSVLGVGLSETARAHRILVGSSGRVLAFTSSCSEPL